VLYDTVLYIVISYLLVCLFIVRGIDYYYSCSIYAATLYVECGPILLHACLRTWLACALQNCDQQNDRESSACARGLNSTGSRGIFGAYILKAIGRTLSELVLLSCVVFMLRPFVELFRKSTAERERCCSTSDISPSVSCRRERCCSSFDIFSSRVASSWTLVFNADHQLDDHRESRETSTEAAGSYRLI